MEEAGFPRKPQSLAELLDAQERSEGLRPTRLVSPVRSRRPGQLAGELAVGLRNSQPSIQAAEQRAKILAAESPEYSQPSNQLAVKADFNSRPGEAQQASNSQPSSHPALQRLVQPTVRLRDVVHRFSSAWLAENPDGPDRIVSTMPPDASSHARRGAEVANAKRTPEERRRVAMLGVEARRRKKVSGHG